MSRSIRIETIQCTSFYQAFDCLFIDLMNVKILNKAENIAWDPFRFTSLDDSIDDPVSHVFHTGKPEPYLSICNRKFLIAFIHIRRQYLDPHLLAVSHVF